MGYLSAEVQKFFVHGAVAGGLYRYVLAGLILAVNVVHIHSFELIQKAYGKLGMNEGKNVASVDIVKELLLTKSHVSISVNGLAARGLLVKVADRNDRKKEYLILTPQAKDIFEDIKHQRAVLLKQMFTGLTTEEVKTLQSLIARVVHNIVPGY